MSNSGPPESDTQEALLDKIEHAAAVAESKGEMVLGQRLAL